MDILFTNPSVSTFYTRLDTSGNSGYDLYAPEDTLIPGHTTVYIHYGVIAVAQSGSGIFLCPRSSISRTPLRLANSIGILDPTYRGEVIAALENTRDDEYHIRRGDRLVQLCLPDLKPFNVHITDVVTQTERGAGGFGSTGR